MTARELDAAMTRLFGVDWREKTIVGPLGSWRLGGAFEECGLRDPLGNPSSGYPGVYQFAPATGLAVPPGPTAQARAMARYVSARYG